MRHTELHKSRLDLILSIIFTLCPIPHFFFCSFLSYPFLSASLFLFFSYFFFPIWNMFKLVLNPMRFDTIISIHVRHDVICFKLGKCLTKCPWFLSDIVIPWTALASSQSKKTTTLTKTFLTASSQRSPRNYYVTFKDIL